MTPINEDKMGFTKDTITPGTGQTPAQGEVVFIHYTGALHDPSNTANHGMGQVYALSHLLPCVLYEVNTDLYAV